MKHRTNRHDNDPEYGIIDEDIENREYYDDIAEENYISSILDNYEN